MTYCGVYKHYPTSPYKDIMNVQWGTVITPTSGGALQSIDIYCNSHWAGNELATCRLYEYNDGINSTLIDSTIPIRGGYSSEWNTFIFETPPTLTANTQYVLTAHSPSTINITYNRSSEDGFTMVSAPNVYNNGPSGIISSWNTTEINSGLCIRGLYEPTGKDIFGWTTTPVSLQGQGENVIRGGLYECPSDGTAKSLAFFISTVDEKTPHLWRAAIFRSGASNTKVGQTNVVMSSSNGWLEIPFTSNIRLSGGVNYYLLGWSDAETGASGFDSDMYVKYIDGCGGFTVKRAGYNFNTQVPSGNFPTTLDWSLKYNDYFWAGHITYELDGEESVDDIQKIMFDNISETNRKINIGSTGTRSIKFS